MPVAIGPTTIYLTPALMQTTGAVLIFASALIALVARKKRPETTRQTHCYPAPAVYREPYVSGPKQKADIPCLVLGEASVFGRPYYVISANNEEIKVPTEHIEFKK